MLDRKNRRAGGRGCRAAGILGSLAALAACLSAACAMPTDPPPAPSGTGSVRVAVEVLDIAALADPAGPAVPQDDSVRGRFVLPSAASMVLYRGSAGAWIELGRRDFSGLGFEKGVDADGLPAARADATFSGIPVGAYAPGSLRLAFLDGAGTELSAGLNSAAVEVSPLPPSAPSPFRVLPLTGKSGRNVGWDAETAAAGDLRIFRFNLFEGEYTEIALEKKGGDGNPVLFFFDEAGRALYRYRYEGTPLRIRNKRPEPATATLYAGVWAAGGRVDFSISHAVFTVPRPATDKLFDFSDPSCDTLEELQAQGWTFSGNPAEVKIAAMADGLGGIGKYLALGGEASATARKPVATLDLGGGVESGRLAFTGFTNTSMSNATVALLNDKKEVLCSFDLWDRFVFAVQCGGASYNAGRTEKIPNGGANNMLTNAKPTDLPLGYSDVEVSWGPDGLTWTWTHWAQGAGGAFAVNHRLADQAGTFLASGSPAYLRIQNEKYNPQWLRIGVADLTITTKDKEVRWLTAREKAEFVKAREGQKARFVAAGVDDAAVSALLAAQAADGSFPGVPYGTPASRVHLENLLPLAVAHASPSSAHRGSAAVADAIARGLGYWFDKGDYTDANWWNNYIGFQRSMGPAVLVFADVLERDYPDLHKKAAAYMRRSYERYLAGVNNSGTANRMDFAYNAAVGALASWDIELLEAAVPIVKDTFVVQSQAGKEGLWPDGSWLEHGPQLHNVTYGTEWLNGAVNFAELFAGTAWDLDPAQAAMVESFYLEGLDRMGYGRWHDFNAMGRGLSRPGSHTVYGTDGKGKFPDTLRRFAALRTPRSAELASMLERRAVEGGRAADIPSATTAFWKSEFLTRTGPGAYASVRLVSTRTYRAERGNNEGRKNRYFGDGVNLTLVKGDEYDFMPALWDYARLPGVTAPQGGTVDPGKDWGVFGSTDYAGVLAGGRNGGGIGVAAMRMDFDGVKADKSWFLLDGMTIAMGTGISGAGPVATTLNQARTAGEPVLLRSADGFVRSISGGSETLPAGGARAAWHRGIGYVVPEGGEGGFLAEVATVAGNYADVCTVDLAASEQVYTLLLSHGMPGAASPASYAYAVLPGSAPEATWAAARDLGATLSKKADAAGATVAHGIHVPSRGIVAAAFFRPGELKLADGVFLRSDAAALVLVDLRSRAAWVQDPLQRSGTARIDAAAGEDTFTLRASFPAGAEAGKTIALRW